MSALQYFFIFLTMIHLASCDNQKINLQLFVPVFDVTSDELINEGFVRVKGADIPMYQKVNSDTTIIFTFDFEQDQILSEEWVITFSNPDSSNISQFFSDNFLPRSSFYQFLENKENIDSRNYIEHPYFNQVYEIKMEEHNLWITFLYPKF